MKHTFILLTAMLLAPLTTLHAADAPKPAKKPNVIVILADDLGWADLSCYGSTFHESPNLDRLAAEGMRFTQAYSSSPYCSPSRAGILTGRHPARVQITDYIPSNGRSGKYLPGEMKMQLSHEEVTLAEVLQDAGYATWHVGKWHLGKEPFLPESQGFDVNVAGNHSGAPASYFWPYGHDMPQRAKAYHGSPVPGLVDRGKEGEHLCDRLTSEAIRLIEQRKADQPFFLYLPFYDVHTPIQAKANLIEKYRAKARRMGIPEEAEFIQEGTAARGTPVGQTIGDRARGQTIGKTRVRQNDPVYAAMVETMDDNVGRLLARLDELGIADNTLVVFTSDNGGHHITSNAPLRGCKGWLYEGGVREPWIVRWPGVTKPGSECKIPVMNTDIMPTVLEIAGLPARPDLHRDGRSFATLLKGGAEPVHEALFWHFPHYGNHGSGPCSSVLRGDWKLIEWLEDDSVELFNLAEDLGEKHDFAAEHPDCVKAMRERLHAWREEVRANMPRPKPPGQIGTPEQKTTKPAIKPQGDFAATANVRVEKTDAGYRLHAASGQAGFALKKLEHPLQRQATFKLRCSTAAGHEFPKRYENGFLTISDSVDPQSHIHVGAFFGGQKKLAVIEGPLQPNTRHSQPLAGSARPLELTIHVNLATSEIALEEADGGRLQAKLERPIRQITHAGYSTLNAVTEFYGLQVKP
jgi:arylsulfatase A-like enzyme